jgi:predicted nucleotidyltransferase
MAWYENIGPNERWLLANLNTHGVPYLIHGGAAVAYYGGRKDNHFSDVDLFLPRNRSVSKRLKPAFEKAAEVTGFLTARAFDLDKMVPGKAFALDKRAFKMDFLVLENATFEMMYARKTIARINLHEVSIASVQDVITFKMNALMNAQAKLDKHRHDIDVLKQLHGIDVPAQ